MATQILMPALSPTMEEGKLAKWLIAEGSRVKPGDVIAEIETDKATMEVEALSVSISAMTSPALMVWPSSTSHLASLPSSMVGDSAGIRISVGMSCQRGSDPSPLGSC